MADEIKKIIPYFEMKFSRLTGTGVCIEEGKMYILNFKKEFTVEEVGDLQQYLQGIEKNYGCKFLVLHGYGEAPSIYQLESYLDRGKVGGKFVPAPFGEVQILHVSPRKFRDDL